MNHDFTKSVSIKAVNDEDMTATGVVMTPNELDRQLDFVDAEGIRRLHTDAPDDGVMHTSFPEGHATLEVNEVLDEPTTIDGVEFEAGDWVIRRSYQNRQRWDLVKDGVLGGYSIGGTISEAETYESIDDLPDAVDTSKVDPDAVAAEYRPLQRLVDGTVNEISDVDRPAVPSAEMAVVKQDLGKNIFERVDGRQEFLALMETRGHGREAASKLWRYLNRTKADTDDSTDTEKPIVLPNGAEFDDFDACVASVSGDGTTEEEARAICGAGREQNKVDVNGVEVDLTPPASMVNAAQAALDAKERLGDEIGDCGSGRGEQRARQIVDGTLAPADFVTTENGTPIPAYLNSHADDAPDTDATPPTWSDETWTDGCGPVQYALWGGTGGGEPRSWAMRRANELAAAMDDDEPYPEIAAVDGNEPAESGADSETTDVMSTTKAEYSADEWVSWEASGGRARGQIVDVTEDGTFDDAISGDVTVDGTEDEPAYLIEVWQGTGDDASPIEEESGRGDTMHVAHQESTLRSVDDPREVEASKSGILASLKSLFGGSDDGKPPEAPDEDGNEDAEKAGRTLSQRNRRAVMAAIDAQLEMLNDAGVDHDMTRFTDRADYAFDLAEYGGGKGQHADEEMDKDAPEGDTSDDTTNMSNDDTEKSEPPAWAESLTEKVESIDKRVSEMEDGEDAEKSLDDAPEWAQDLAEKVDGLDERVDAVSKATADTQQTGGTETTGGEGDDLGKVEKQKRELFFGGA